MSSAWRRYRIRVLNTFIIFHIAAILLGSSQVWPTPLRPILIPYLHWIRLSQSWILFGPEPDKVAKKYRIDIEYTDGTKETWHRPYPPNWDFFERHEAYNWQKHDLSARYLEKVPSCRRDFVDYVLRNHLNPSNPPVRLTLVRSSAGWPAPTASRDLEYDENTLKWVDVKIETFVVKDGKLE